MAQNSISPQFSGPFSRHQRTSAFKKANHPDQIFDICVVGGGITGAAIARDAALRGLSVLLLEKDDFASGTSSRSSKLVHGGVRYLEQYEFKLVMESTYERALLWKLAPHLVTPLPFLFPSYVGGRVPLWKLNAGLWLYDLLAKFRLPSLHKRYFKKRTLIEEPALKSAGLRGSIFYWDGATNDALLTLANIVDAFKAGAQTLSRCRLTRVEWNHASPQGQAHRLFLHDELNGSSSLAHARVVVSALGPWTDEFLKADAAIARPRLLAPTRGSHIVLTQKRLPTRNAVTLFHPRDGRVLFTIPWGDCTIVGTTDLFDDQSPDRTSISSDEVDYLLEAANEFYPGRALKRDDVLSTWSGLRPLLAPPDKASASQISREHHLSFEEPGLLLIAGGKLTTHREMAEQAVDTLLKGTQNWAKPLQKNFIKTITQHRPLPAFEFPVGSAPRLGSSEASALSPDDVRGICRSQMVLSLEDFMVRRTSLFYKEADNGIAMLPFLKTPLCAELDWNDKDWDREVARYEDYLELNVRAPLGRSSRL